MLHPSQAFQTFKHPYMGYDKRARKGANSKNSGITAGSFGVVGLVFALQFFADVPKVRTDIMQKLPLIGDYFIRDLPPSDNVSILLSPPSCAFG